MVRYIWDLNFGNKIWKDPDFSEFTDLLRYNHQEVRNRIKLNWFVNILERKGHTIKVKVFLPGGDVLEGYVSDLVSPIKLVNEEELFDGRFNQ